MPLAHDVSAGVGEAEIERRSRRAEHGGPRTQLSQAGAMVASAARVRAEAGTTNFRGRTRAGATDRGIPPGRRAR
jgi:hypothetical protein